MGAPDSIGEPLHDNIVLFDGVCNLCNGAVQFIIRNDPKKKFRFTSLQSDTAKSLLKQQDWSTDIYSIILIKQGKIYHRSNAVLAISKDLSWPWKLLYGAKILPRFFRDALYGVVARNRYRWFGKQNECWLPSADLKGRFI